MAQIMLLNYSTIDNRNSWLRVSIIYDSSYQGWLCIVLVQLGAHAHAREQFVRGAWGWGLSLVGLGTSGA